MLSNIGPVQLLIVLAIVLAIFGTKRLRTLGSDLGSAVKGFRSAVSEADEAADQIKVLGADPGKGAEYFDQLVILCRNSLDHVETGEFGADMQVSLVNDGPVTFWLES